MSNVDIQIHTTHTYDILIPKYSIELQRNFAANSVDVKYIVCSCIITAEFSLV